MEKNMNIVQIYEICQ